MTFFVNKHFQKDTEEYRRAYGFARNCAITILLYPVISLIMQNNALYRETSPLPFICFNIIALGILYYKGDLGLAVNLLSGGLLCNMIVSILQTGGVYSCFFIWLMLPPIYALTVGSLKKGLFWSIATIFSTVLIYVLDKTVFNDAYKEANELNVLINYMGLFSLVLGALASYELLKERQHNIIAKQLEDLLKQSEILTQKNIELERFAYIASHDLKTPLRNIISFSGLLNRKLRFSEDADVKQYIGFIKDYAHHMTHIVDDILEFAKITETDNQNIDAVDLEEVTNIVLMSLQEKIDTSHAIVLIEDKLPQIKGDKTHFIQLMQNLIENALTYNEKPQPEITIGLGKDRTSGTYIYVKDNGIGVDTPYQDKIFDMFTRLHSIDKYPGTGLGLAICKKIVVQYGGRIWIDSTLNKGTTVNFYLPMAA
jgi:signal transduction histidine kinase